MKKLLRRLMILLRFSRPVVTARVAIWPKTSTRTENVVETTTWRPLVDPRNSSTLGFYGWLLMMVYKWWYIHYGLVTFFCHALVGEIATALARWDHDPWRPAAGTLFSAAKTVIASFADVDVCIPCSISHYSFIYTSLYIYTNLYQFIYQSISFYIIYLCFTWFLYCCCSTCSSWLTHLKHFGIFWPSLWAPASLWLRQVGKNYLTWPGGQSPRLCHDVFGDEPSKK